MRWFKHKLLIALISVEGMARLNTRPIALYLAMQLLNEEGVDDE